MPFGLVFFSQCIAFSFYRNNMQQFGAGDILQILQGIYQLGDIVPIDRAEITQVERFKKLLLLTYKSL